MNVLFLLLTLLFSLNCFAQQADNSLIIQTDKQNTKQSEQFAFTILAHKPNYILPFSYNNKLQEQNVYGQGPEPERLEFKYQISLKMAMLEDIADSGLSIYLGYTQLSYWQAYNFDKSIAFRETNYEPELFFQWFSDIKLSQNWSLRKGTLGIVHQSNGCSYPLGRSWNRIESRIYFERDNMQIIFNPWVRLKESASRDMNPDITDYLGHGQFTLAYQWHKHTFSLTSRNNLESGFSQGSIEGAWSFPIHGKLRGYMQVFSGYGNSLIEYNQYTNTLGLGLSFSDWL